MKINYELLKEFLAGDSRLVHRQEARKYIARRFEIQEAARLARRPASTDPAKIKKREAMARYRAGLKSRDTRDRDRDMPSMGYHTKDEALDLARKVLKMNDEG